MKTFSFELIHQSSQSAARVGRIHTPHGVIDTPHFVPVGTNATLKALDSKLLDELDVQLMFCNTYHLLIQPGTEIIKQAGGLHSFMNRSKPIITDSGGFQVFSLAYGGVASELKSKGTKKYDSNVAKITEDGVLFRSYRDGAALLLTPESSVEAQKILGADIIIPFDELPPYHIDKEGLKRSVDRTHRWEKRSLDKHLESPNNQAMYGVIHGGIDKELRTKSSSFIASLPFDGFAVGGSIGKNHDEMIEILKHTLPQLPKEKPVHLLGMGDLRSIRSCIPLGIDTFDSSHPTKCARHGFLFTSAGNVKILNSENKYRFDAIDQACECYTCKHYTRAYLHHLFKAHELTAYSLASVHNIHFMMKLMEQYRTLILMDQI